MKFSVVTISYNQASYLEECLDSVLSQEHEGVDIEYIVIDACSTDGSAEILEHYRNHLSTLIIEKDDGPPDGLNKGFSHATGDIYYYLNSDDVVLPGAFASAAKIFTEQPDADIVYGDGFQIDADGSRLLKSYSVENYTIYRELVGAAMIFQQATFFRSNVFEKAGGFNTGNQVCWDGELWVDMAKVGAKFKHVPEFWGAFRIYDGTISGGSKERRYRQVLKERSRMFRSSYARDLDIRDKLSNLAFRVANKLVVLRR